MKFEFESDFNIEFDDDFNIVINRFKLKNISHNSERFTEHFFEDYTLTFYNKDDSILCRKEIERLFKRYKYKYIFK
jgi:hypothetical protein